MGGGCLQPLPPQLLPSPFSLPSTPSAGPVQLLCCYLSSSVVRPSCLRALTVKCVLDAGLNPALPEGKDQQEAALHFLGRPECDSVGVFAEMTAGLTGNAPVIGRQLGTLLYACCGVPQPCMEILFSPATPAASSVSSGIG